MTDYIEREAAIAALLYARGRTPEDDINSVPAADVQEVVRCRDCDMVQVCKYAQYLGLDGYCSNGERRGADMREES